ncbi:MAG: M15 family metallopeptidase [Clostridiales bacterium]|nr:M15 family metallopeptidase [Clostridiales bacterium]
MRRWVRLTGLLLCIILLVGCNSKPETETTVTVTETTAYQTETTIQPTAVPTPTRVPTPEPSYIEPLYEETWYNGFVDPYSVRAQIIDNPDDLLALVNKYYAIPEDYVPSDLVDAPHSYDQKLRKEANDAWEKMYDDCLSETGHGLLLVSGWRDLGTQQFLFDRSKNKNGFAFACQKNALPQRSEHHLGLALDLTPDYWDNIYDNFPKTEVGQWVNEHCYEYGFILRYQSQYTDETGYGTETWHYRYVGVEVATYLYENDISLEAYLGKAQVLPDDE